MSAVHLVDEMMIHEQLAPRAELDRISRLDAHSQRFLTCDGALILSGESWTEKTGLMKSARVDVGRDFRLIMVS